MFYQALFLGIFLGTLIGVFIMCVFVFNKEDARRRIQKRFNDPKPGEPLNEKIK
jgi:hypothetical protein